MPNKKLEPIFSVTPALQKYLRKAGKQKSNFPGMNKQEAFIHPNALFRRGDGCRIVAGLFVER